MPRVRQGEWWHAVRDLTRDTQALPAASEDLQAGRRTQQGFGELGADRDQMLAVVQEYQQGFGPQVVHERLQKGATGLLPHAKRHRDRLGNERRIGQGSQLDMPHPGGKSVLDVRVRRQLQRQPRLARSARPGEREQAMRQEQRLHFRQLALAPDKTGELDRQVGLRGRRLSGPDRLRLRLRVHLQRLLISVPGGRARRHPEFALQDGGAGLVDAPHPCPIPTSRVQSHQGAIGLLTQRVVSQQALGRG